MILFELFTYFAIISMLAFGGGNAVISLLERISVDEMRWITPQDFAAAIGFAYITPGPVLITSAFFGYRAAGFLGATVATLGGLPHPLVVVSPGFTPSAPVYPTSVVTRLRSWGGACRNWIAWDNRIHPRTLRVLWLALLDYRRCGARSQPTYQSQPHFYLNRRHRARSFGWLAADRLRFLYGERDVIESNFIRELQTADREI
jgi:hypothetical protein